ncbi:protein FAM90A1-like [Moschus berezovskii]|uniref:protein FAM90A1-like n=1 Tax=Moschus berezovskii TaxID=68408 RepID=UPI0024449D37|nr:protein FAM90A1-like [Moschus berezovskii]
MAGHYGWLRACRLFQDQKVRKQNAGPGRQTAAAPQETDSMVKCKDCGAFGHTARSLRCPMKRWQGALVPLPLGSRLGKENLAWKLQDPPTPGTPNTAEREEEERQRKEEQQRKLLQRFPRRPRGQQPQSWKEELEPGHWLRMPFFTVPLILHSYLYVCQEVGRNMEKPRLRSVQTPPESTPTADLGAFLNLPPPPSTAGRGPRVAARVSRKTPAQGQCFDRQPPADRSPSRSVCAESAAHHPPITCGPGQPLRMLFLREGEGCWSCRYTVPRSPRPAQRPAPPAQSPAMNQEPEGHAVPGPRSVLYDDLQVSSSEESDWDEDTSGT